jgi:hypothetical protein
MTKNMIEEVLIADHATAIPYHPLTEKELADRIDRSLKHVAQGLFQESEEMEAELIAEFDL